MFLHFYYQCVCFIDLVVAYKKLKLEKNVLEETLKASSGYEKDDISETDASEVQKYFILLTFSVLTPIPYFMFIFLLILKLKLFF